MSASESNWFDQTFRNIVVSSYHAFKAAVAWSQDTEQLVDNGLDRQATPERSRNRSVTIVQTNNNTVAKGKLVLRSHPNGPLHIDG